MRLLLIRHAQSTYNAVGRIQGWSDPSLSELGRMQAFALAQRLREEYDIAALYSSTLSRAHETAQVIAHALGLTITLDERLKERHIGIITGLYLTEVEEQYPEIVQRWQHDPCHVAIPGEEDTDVFYQRVISAMDEIVARHGEDDTVAVVAHGGSLGAYLAGLLGLDFHKRQPWIFDNASLSIVILGGARPRIALLNDTCHLKMLVTEYNASR